MGASHPLREEEGEVRKERQGPGRQAAIFLHPLRRVGSVLLFPKLAQARGELSQSSPG